MTAGGAAAATAYSATTTATLNHAIRSQNRNFPVLISPIQTGGQNSLVFAAIAFAAIRRHTGWWPATVAIASYLLPKQEGVTSNCSKRVCCNYLERILTPCPAYLCSFKYLGKNYRRSSTNLQLCRKRSRPQHGSSCSTRG